MNIPQLSTAMSTANLQSDFGVAMLSKNLDNSQQQGASLVGMMNSSMELSVNPSVGSTMDLRV